MTEKSDAAETAAERKRGTGAAAGAVKAATAASGPDRSVRRGKVLFQVAPTRSATTFLKPFILSKFKLHPMLDVRQRSRLFTEEGKRVPRTLTNTLLYTAGSGLGGRNRLKSKKNADQ